LFFSFVFHKAREAAKSGLVMFHEAMEELVLEELTDSFGRFERAAAKGHEESAWIISVVKDVKMKEGAWKEAFAHTDEPLGWYFAGKLSDDGRERFDFYKKSAEGGCSWGQVGCCWYFEDEGDVVEQDRKAYVELLEKAANQNNPWAMQELGQWFRGEAEGNDEDKALAYYRAGAALGWKYSMRLLSMMMSNGEGCAKDVRQALFWGAKGDSWEFWGALQDVRQSCEKGATKQLEGDFNQLCYSIGWGLYWYLYGTGDWIWRSDGRKAFGNRCLDFYCSCVELQQKSIITFLLFWNRTTGGVKEVGVIIGTMAWEGREDNLVKEFEVRSE
jgi:hypothetical protein